MKAFVTTISLVLFWTANAAGQGIFRTAQLLANRSATANCLIVEDNEGNQYQAITFFDTLKLKNPDQTLAIRDLASRPHGRSGVALMKVDRFGRRRQVQTLTDSAHSLRAQSLNWLPGRDLELAFGAAGAVLRNGVPIANRASAAGRYLGEGYLVLDTGLAIRSNYQISFSTAGAFIPNAFGSGPGFFHSTGTNITSDTLSLNGQRFVLPATIQNRFNSQYTFLATTPKNGGPTRLTYFWSEAGNQGVPYINRITYDAEGNQYLVVSAFRTGNVWMNDTIIGASRDAGNYILKLSPSGHLLWSKLISAKYLLEVTALAPSPLGDKVYLGLSVLGRTVLAGRQFDTDTVVSPSCPQTYLGLMGALVLDAATGQDLNGMVFNNRPAHYTHQSRLDNIVVLPYGEVYWGGSIKGNPTLFGGPPVRGWQTLFVAATGPNLELRWLSLIGGPVDGTERQLVSMRYSPYMQELQLVGGLTSWPLATAVGVGNTIVNATRPALFTAALRGLRVTGLGQAAATLAPYPNPAVAGAFISAGIGGTGPFALADAIGRRFACTPMPDGRLRLPQVVPGVYTLMGPQGQKARLVIEP